MEKWLLRHIGTIAIIFGLIVFLSWIIPLFNYPVLIWVQNLTGIQEIKRISTQYMFTTLGAIFAFWYGYKKYEEGKDLEAIKLFNINEKKSDDFRSWELAYNMYINNLLSKHLYDIIEYDNIQKLNVLLLDFWDDKNINWVGELGEFDNNSSFYKKILKIIYQKINNDGSGFSKSVEEVYIILGGKEDKNNVRGDFYQEYFNKFN